MGMNGWIGEKKLMDKNKELMGFHVLALILTLIILQHFTVGFLPVIKCD